MAVLGSSRRLTAALIAATCIESIEARAQDATWLASPSSNNFTSGANWSTGSVPSGTAFFGNSNTTTINPGLTPAIDGMTFNADAPAYVFNGPFRFGGAGIVNNSPFAPTFNNVGLFSLLSFNNGATAGNAVINNSGTLVFNQSATADRATITNSGTLNFNATSSAGNATITNQGMINFSGSSTAGSATIVTNSGGTTDFFRNADGGTARLITNAGGTVDVSGLGFRVLGSMSVGSIEGAGSYVLGDSILTVGTNDLSTTVSGVISGDGGALVKVGSGTLTLSGANTFTGGTIVHSGALLVTGSLASSVTVNDGGLLAGNGIVGGATINSGGIIQPGPGFVPLNVMGTFTQNPGSTYIVTVNPAGQSNLINVVGKAILNGGTVSAQFPPGEYANNTKYTILSAIDGVSGSFSGLSTTRNFAFLTPSLAYDPNNVFLVLAFNGFESGSRTADEHSVAHALDVVAHTATGDLGMVIADLEELGANGGAAALDAISGQPYADLPTVRIQVAKAFLNTISAQTAASRGGLGSGTSARTSLSQACNAACDTAEPARWGAWLSGVGGAGSVPGDGNATTLTYNFGGAAVGLDYRINPQFLVGIGLGYITGTQWANAFAGQAMTNAVSGSLYASFTQGSFYFDGSAGYAHFADWMTRTIAIPGLSVRNAQGQVSADQFLGQLETGYRIALPIAAPFAVTPFARLQGSTTNQAGLTETGGNSLDLMIAPQTTNSLRSTLGAELAATFATEHKVAGNFRVGWQHEFADTGRSMSAAFAGAPGDAFTVFGATPQRDSAAIGFSLRALVSEATEFYARYDGEVGGGTDNHAVTAGLRLRW
jgi:autotransporter-associated beta strand protein